MKVNSYDSLLLVKTVTFYNVIILKFWNKYQNHYYYNILLEKASYEGPKR